MKMDESEQKDNMQDFEGRWLKRFREFAEENEGDAGIAGWSVSGLDARLWRFKQLWETDGKQSGNLWLDAGCGAGSYTRYLTENGKIVLGLDYSLPTLCKASERCISSKLWAIGDVRKLPVKKGTFDGVICFGVTQALSESEVAIQELALSIRKGGEIWIDGLNGWCLPNMFNRFIRHLQGRPIHLRYESAWALRRLFKKNKLENIRIHWLPIAPGKLTFIQPILQHSIFQNLLRIVPLFGVLLSHAFIITANK